MGPPKERKRKFHRRSKNGCGTCKRRHVRCDERKPLCTTCLHSGSECIYPSTEEGGPSSLEDDSVRGADSPNDQASTAQPSPEIDNTLTSYVGGSFEELPEASKRLLRYFSQYALSGQRPVLREMESSAIHRAFENPGYMHMCLMLAACQWAWVTGSMDAVKIPFLYHKAATYQFAREQMQDPATAQSGDAMLAISALALTEGAIGELETSTKHLRAIRWTSSQENRNNHEASLPQRMLKMVGDGLRNDRTGQLLDVPDYQPTLMALLFASIWDITALPPREAPRYGWWEENDTAAARLWQNHTRQLNLNYEISRDFAPNEYVPRILNGDPRSSRTSFIATFFYLCTELCHDQMNVMLIDWLLEQLIEDTKVDISALLGNPGSQSVWLWCVLFGAAIVQMGKANDLVETRQLQKWRDVYDEKIGLAARSFGFESWEGAKAILTKIVGTIDQDTDQALHEVWDLAMARISWLDRDGGPAVVELIDEE